MTDFMENLKNYRKNKEICLLVQNSDIWLLTELLEPNQYTPNITESIEINCF